MVAGVTVLTACGKSHEDKSKAGAKPVKVPNTSTKNALEVRRVFAEFRVREEQYRTEHNAYLATGSEDARWPPVLAYGKKHAALTLPPAWQKLHIKLDPKALRCSYAVVTGAANDASNVGAIAQKRFGMTQVDKRTSSAGQIDRSIKKIPDQSWFYLLAECDGDGDPKRNAFWLLRSDLRQTFRVDRRH